MQAPFYINRAAVPVIPILSRRRHMSLRVFPSLPEEDDRVCERSPPHKSAVRLRPAHKQQTIRKKSADNMHTICTFYADTNQMKMYNEVCTPLGLGQDRHS